MLQTTAEEVSAAEERFHAEYTAAIGSRRSIELEPQYGNRAHLEKGECAGEFSTRPLANDLPLGGLHGSQHLTSRVSLDCVLTPLRGRCAAAEGHKLQLGWNLGNPQYSMLCGEQSGFCELCGEKQPLKEMSCCSECETVDFCQTCLAMART